jgi:hypothetical protein
MNRKKSIIVFVLLLCQIYVSYSQLKISGRVVDNETSLGMESAHVFLLNRDSVFVKGTVTDPLGDFELKNIPKDTYFVNISSIGYSKFMIAVENLNSHLDLGEVRLYVETSILDEIVVTPEASVVKPDKKIFFPTLSQLKASPSAFDMLEKLQLSRIVINPVSKTVAGLGGGSVQFRINNVQASINDIQSIQSSDLMRVEYLDDPGVKYGEADIVINFITRRRISGGNVFVNLNNGLFQHTTMLDNQISTKLNHKKSEWAFRLSGRNVASSWVRENEERFYFSDEPLIRKERGQPTKYKEDNLGASLSYSFSDPEKHFFSAIIKNHLQNEPNSFSDRTSVIEATPVSDELAVYSHTEGKTNTSSVDLYYQRILGKNQSLIINAVGTNNYSKTSRLYQESAAGGVLTDVYSDITGDKYSLILEGLYEKEMTAGNLTVGAKHTQSYTDNTYAGTIEQVVDMTVFENHLYAEYRFAKGKFTYRFGIGIQNNKLKQGTLNIERYIFRPTVMVSYAVNSNLYLRYNGRVSSNSPSLSALNEVEQKIDSFQIRRGNPALYMNPVYTNSFSAGWKRGMLETELFSTLRYDNKPVTDKLLFENEKFVNTYANQGSYLKWNNYLNVKLNLFNGHVSFGFTPGLNRFVSKGDGYEHALSNRYMKIDIWGYYKNFSGTLGMYTYDKVLSGETVQSNEKAHFLSLSYNQPKYSVGIWVFNPFTTRYEQYTERLSSKLSSFSRLYTNDMSPFFSLTASFKFDFGRRNQSMRKKFENTDTDKGILSGEK